MANSSTVSSGDLATATQYNNLRSDVLDTSTGHVHDGTNGRGDAQTILQVSGNPLVVENSTDATSNQVLLLRGDNATRDDGDEVYVSFYLNDSGGNSTEFARITAEAVDVTDGQEDGQLRFGVAKTNGTITDVFTINSSTGGETSMTLDVSGDLTLDADGGDIFFKDGGTTFGSATNNSGNLIIKSGTTTALNFSGADVTVAGDLTITGDDLKMTTNTDTYILVADGTSYNPVAVSGDVTIANNGAVTIANDAVESGMLNDNVISGQTELASGGIAAADELPISDGGTLKKIGVDNFIIDAPALLTEAAIANGDYVVFLDGGATGSAKKEALADVATLFAGTGMTATSSVVNVIGGDGITANSNDVAVTAAQTTITSVLNASLVVGRDADNDIDFATDNNIRFRAGGEDQLTLTDGALTPSSNAIVDLGTDALEFKDAYFDGTLEADAITIGGTNVVTGSLITTLGTISAGVWEGTDVAVAHGGTGASSLTDGGVLLGSGTGAVTAMAVLADSEMIVGDGTTDPVAESGATLRTSIGVGTGNNVEFAAITGTTIDATTDFTIGDTVVTNGVITDSSGLALAANVTVTGNVLPNADDTYDLGSASAAWQDLFLEGDLTMTDAGTIATSAGILTIDGDDGILLTQGGSGGLDIAGYAAVGSGEGGAGLFSKHTFIVDRNHTVNAGGSQLFVKGDMTIDGGTNEYAQIYAGSDSGYNTSFVINSGGVHPYISTAAFYEPNITETSGSVTNAVVMQLVDAPTEGTNNYSLWCRQVSGRANYARFDSGVIIGNTTSTNSLIDDSTTGSGTVTLYIGTNTIDVTDPSDSILKENIEDTSIDSLSILDQLRLRDFNWKSDNENYGHRTERQFGMVAQEVEEVLPHLVRQDDDGIRNVQYNRMIPYLVKAIQELNQELQEIKGGS